MSPIKHKLITTMYIALSLTIISCSSEPKKDYQNDTAFTVNMNDSSVNMSSDAGTNPIVVSCPQDMVHVKGEFCPELSQTCLRWKDKAWCRKHDLLNKTKCIDLVSPVACQEFKSPSKCLSKTTRHMDFCIDIYEAGVNKGDVPPYMESFLSGEIKCKAKGKRLCSDVEWTQACEGPGRTPYPYGYIRNSNACNIDHPQIAGFNAAKVTKWTPELLQSLDKRVPAGSMPLCISAYGVMDMTGNVDEATVNVTGGGKPFRNALKGGHWVAGARNRCRPKTDSHEVSFVNYESSFRCCKDSSY